VSLEEGASGKATDEETVYGGVVLPVEYIDGEVLSVENAIIIDTSQSADEETISATVANFLCKTKVMNDSTQYW
jgi:hypothetical protein